MALLVLGVLLWWGAHLFKRIAPGPRASMGDKGKGLVAAALAVAILLMIFGYKAADGAFFWGRHPATVGINNLLMLASLYFFSPGPKKGALFYRMRHPMLTGFLLWTVAHLLVNGDVPSFVLFGGLGIWAVVEMIVINRAEPEWTPPAKGPIKKDVIFLAASLVLLVVIGFVHTWLGYPAFG
ncbi:NnrU family protein [Salipiger mucosus]|uniref:NnrU family protein in cluster with Mesaconyl-CoA hydratase n=1 Tax=Salipiger mucosus DSM 16094 TaxID=1123237 RepID=S9SGW1_9RHOB|nr:NnrU family protein [Salipiger mucosus]EPX85514.1 NnrU family protein in cluster with Mesaconyl-CoA hydratase [Salipiger mucosus DSM 16094]